MPMFRFDIIARADPQTLPRLLNPFAQIGMVPKRVNAAEADDLLTVRIDQPALGEQQARIIAEKMRGSVLVEAVRLRRGRQTLLPAGQAP